MAARTGIRWNQNMPWNSAIKCIVEIDLEHMSMRLRQQTRDADP